LETAIAGQESKNKENEQDIEGEDKKSLPMWAGNVRPLLEVVTEIYKRQGRGSSKSGGEFSEVQEEKSTHDCRGK